MLESGPVDMASWVDKIILIEGKIRPSVVLSRNVVSKLHAIKSIFNNFVELSHR